MPKSYLFAITVENQEGAGEGGLEPATQNSGEGPTAGVPLSDFVLQLEDYTPTVSYIPRNMFYGNGNND